MNFYYFTEAVVITLNTFLRLSASTYDSTSIRFAGHKACTWYIFGLFIKL